MRRRAGLQTAAWAAIVAITFPGSARAEAIYNGTDTIVVSGSGNTLSSIAADIRDPDAFTYDGTARTASCRCRLVVNDKAELTLGKKGDKQAAETLNMVCAPEMERDSLAISVEGALNLYHSRVQGQGSRIGKTVYYRMGRGIGYSSKANGELIDAAVSGAYTGVAIAAGDNRQITIDGLEISDCRIGVSYHASRGRSTVAIVRLRVEDTKCGVYLRTPNARPEPAILRECDLGKSTLIVFNKSNGGCAVHLVDSDFDRRRITIQNNPGKNRVLVRWTQLVQVVDDVELTPCSGAKLRLTSRAEDGDLPPATIETDSEGRAWIEVPEVVVVQTGEDRAAMDFRNTLEIDTGDGYRVLKESLVCGKRGAAKFARLADGKYTEHAMEYEEGRSQASAVLNHCANSSFEIESIRGFPDFWWPHNWHEVKDGWGITEKGGKPKFYGIDREQAIHGKNSLQIPPHFGLSNYGYQMATMAKGKTYTVSFHARSDVATNELRVAAYTSRTHFTVGKEWTRYSLVWTNLTREAYLMFGNQGEGRLWVDAVQIEEGVELHPYVPDGYKAVRY